MRRTVWSLLAQGRGPSLIVISKPGPIYVLGALLISEIINKALPQLHRTEDELKDWQENMALFKQLQAGDVLPTAAKEGLIYYFQACQKNFSEQRAMHTAFRKALPLVESVLTVLEAKCQATLIRASP